MVNHAKILSFQTKASYVARPTGSRSIGRIQLIVWATDHRDFNSIIVLKVICVGAPSNRGASDKKNRNYFWCVAKDGTDRLIRWRS